MLIIKYKLSVKSLCYKIYQKITAYKLIDAIIILSDLWIMVAIEVTTFALFTDANAKPKGVDIPVNYIDALIFKLADVGGNICASTIAILPRSATKIFVSLYARIVLGSLKLPLLTLK